MHTAQLLRSDESISDANFHHSVLLICENNHEGAWGVVINKRSIRVFNELVEFQHCLPFPLYIGGPMENENLFFVHCRPDLIPDGQQIHDNLYWGGDFKHAVELIQSKQLNENNVRFYLGYCGWDTNELEEEIKEGSWHPCPFQYDSIFTSNEKSLWQDIAKK